MKRTLIILVHIRRRSALVISLISCDRARNGARIRTEPSVQYVYYQHVCEVTPLGRRLSFEVDVLCAALRIINTFANSKSQVFGKNTGLLIIELLRVLKSVSFPHVAKSRADQGHIWIERAVIGLFYRSFAGFLSVFRINLCVKCCYNISNDLILSVLLCFICIITYNAVWSHVSIDLTVVYIHI